MAGLLLLILFFTDTEDTPNIIEPPLPVDVKFPQAYDVPDLNKSIELYKQADKEISSFEFQNIIVASSLYRESVENNFNNDDAMAKLIKSYTMLLANSVNKADDIETIFKLIQVTKSKYISNPNLASAIADFYNYNKKHSAAKLVVEKYLSDSTKPKTLELAASYLTATSNLDEPDKYNDVYNTLLTAKSKSIEVVLQIMDHLLLHSKYDELERFINLEKDNFGDVIAFQIRRLEFLARTEKFDEASKLVVKIKKKSCDRSVDLCNKFYQSVGLVAAHFGEVDSIIKAYTSLPIEAKQSILSMRLAKLDIESADPRIKKMIEESKALAKIEEAKNFIKLSQWKKAFAAMLEATNIAPDCNIARIYLAKMQTEKSMFEEAIKTMELLYKNNPNDADIVFGLLDAYVKAYRYTDIKRMLALLSTSDFKNDSRYYALTAEYYLSKNEDINAINWLQLAIAKDPINDDLIYKLALVFLKNKQFSQARFLLNKIIDLDPSKIIYKVKYADIIYESDSVETAIGYLYDLEKDNSNSIDILSAIGIMYYRSGQIKLFEKTKEKINLLGAQTKTLYLFLIEAAKLDDKIDEVIINAQKVIEIDSGDLAMRMFLAQIYIDKEDYESGVKQLNAIKELSPNYPSLNYQFGKLNLLLPNGIESALKHAKAEVEDNPNQDIGYVLLAEIYLKMENYIDAESNYKTAQRYNAKNVEAIVGLGTISFRKNQYDIALDLFLKAKEIDPSRSDVYKLIGDVYRKMGQTQLAVESYKEHLELSPNSSYKEQLHNYINLLQ